MTKEQSRIHVGIDVAMHKLAVAIARDDILDDVLSLATFENIPASLEHLLKTLSGICSHSHSTPQCQIARLVSSCHYSKSNPR